MHLKKEHKKNCPKFLLPATTSGSAVFLMFTAVSSTFLFCACASAKTLYVDQASGNDNTSYIANDETHSWATIGRAAWGSADRTTANSQQAAQAGDTVIVRTGTYTTRGTNIRYDPDLNPVNSGSAGAPIIFRAEGSVIIRPVIDLSGVVQAASEATVSLEQSASAENDAYAGWSIRIVSGTGAGQVRKIANEQLPYTSLTTTGSYNGATRTASLQRRCTVVPDTTSRYEITKPGPLIGALNRNYITWDGFRILEGDSYRSDTGPVVVWSSSNVTLENLEIVGTALAVMFDNHNGIRAANSSNLVVRNCVIHGFRSEVIQGINNPQNESAVTIYSSNNLLFENNLVYDNFTGFFPKANFGGHIFRFNEVRDCVKPFRISYHTNVDIYQNIIRDGEELGFQPAENNSNVRFYNNTIYNLPSGLNNWFGVNGVDVYNNIFAAVDFPFRLESSAGNFTANNNLYHQFNDFVVEDRSVGGFSQWQALGYDANSLTADPLFVNPANADFHLQSSSPARNTGRGGTTMGAYVTGNEVIGIGGAAHTDNVPPAVPAGLSVL